MQAGLEYCYDDEEISLMKLYAIENANIFNSLDEDDLEKQHEVLSEILGAVGEKVWIAKRFCFDNGKNIFIGNNFTGNFNLTILDIKEVYIGDNVMIGYYKDPQRTREVFTDDGYFRTNDLATVDKKGRYYIKGRLKNVIIGPSGENIYPEEIEKVINDIDGVNESIVLKRDGRLIALVQFNDNVIDWNQDGEDKLFESIEEKKKLVMDYVNKQVSKFSKINSVEVMKDPFEKTATQKIRRYKYEKQENNGEAIDSKKKNDKTKEDKEKNSK